MPDAPIKVLMTADAIGGIWTYALDLAEALRSVPIDITLAVLGPGLDEDKRLAAEAAGVQLVDLGHAPEWLADGPDAVARGAVALAGLARQVGVDLVHLNHPALGAQAEFGCPVLAVCHSCVATWWAAVRGTPLPAEFAWQAELLGRGYRAATGLAAPTRAFAVTTCDAYGLASHPQVVPNGRAAWTGAAPSSPVRGGLTVGRLWDEGKDVATLDRAATLTRVPIRAVGPTRGPNDATVTLDHLDAPGERGGSEIRQLLANRPLFFSAARYEPFGLSVLEAAQAGCALVLSDIATFRELWADCAVFVAPGDASGFAAAADRLAADPGERAALGRAATERAARYTLAAAAQRLVALYRDMLARPPLEARTSDRAA